MEPAPEEAHDVEGGMLGRPMSLRGLDGPVARPHPRDSPSRPRLPALTPSGSLDAEAAAEVKDAHRAVTAQPSGSRSGSGTSSPAVVEPLNERRKPRSSDSWSFAEADAGARQARRASAARRSTVSSSAASHGAGRRKKQAEDTEAVNSRGVFMWGSSGASGSATGCECAHAPPIVQRLARHCPAAHWLLPLVLACVGVYITIVFQQQVDSTSRESARQLMYEAWRDQIGRQLGDTMREPLLTSMHAVSMMRHTVRSLPFDDAMRYDMPIMPAIDAAMQYNTRGIAASLESLETGIFAAGYMRYVHRSQMSAIEADLTRSLGLTVQIAPLPPEVEYTGVLTHVRPPILAELVSGFNFASFQGFYDQMFRMVQSGGIAGASFFQVELPYSLTGDLGSVFNKFSRAIGFAAPTYRLSNASTASLNSLRRTEASAYLDPPTPAERQSKLHGFSFAVVNVPAFFNFTLREAIEAETTIVVEDGFPASNGDDWGETPMVGPHGTSNWVHWHTVDEDAEENDDGDRLADYPCGTLRKVWMNVPAYARSVPRGGDGAEPDPSSPEYARELADACAHIASLPPRLRMRQTLDVGGSKLVFHLGASASLTASDALPGVTSSPEVMATGLATTALVVLSTVAVIYANKQRTHRVHQAGAARAAEAARVAHEETMSYACHELRNPLHAVSATATFLLRDLDMLTDVLAQSGRDTGTAATEERKPQQGLYVPGALGGSGDIKIDEDLDAAAPGVTEVVSSLRRDLHTIVGSSKLMQTVIDDLLDYAKLRRGQLEILPSMVTLRAVVSDLVAAHRAFANTGVAVSAYVAPNVPEQVYADELRLRQVLANGLSNACKLVTSGSIEIRISISTDAKGRTLVDDPVDAIGVAVAAPAVTPASVRHAAATKSDRHNVTTPSAVVVVTTSTRTRPLGMERSSAGASTDSVMKANRNSVATGAYLLVEVLDTGPGLRGSDAMALFEPFEQGALARRERRRNSAARRDRAKAGTGLGLAICYQLVGCMGGAIGLEDRIDPSSAVDSSPVSPKRISAASAASKARKGSGSTGMASPRSTESRVVAGARFWFTVPLLAVKHATARAPKKSPSGALSGGLSVVPPAAELGSASVPRDRKGGATDSPMGIGGAGIDAGRAWSEPSPSSDGSGALTPTHSTPGGLSTAAARAVLEGTHWLVVDDENINRRIAARFLNTLGATCAMLDDGDLVEPYLRENHPWALAPEGADGYGTGEDGSGGGSRPAYGRLTSAISAMSDRDDRVRANSIVQVGHLEADVGGGEKPLAGVLMDIEMKRSRGDRVCKELRACGLRLPVIACTGNASAHDTQVYMGDMGMTRVVTKPFGLATFSEALVQGQAVARLKATSSGAH